MFLQEATQLGVLASEATDFALAHFTRILAS